MVVSFVAVLLVGVLLHYLCYDESGQLSSLSHMVKVTGFAAPSLSVAYYAPRLFVYDETINPAYPQMSPIDPMDFVYEK